MLDTDALNELLLDSSQPMIIQGIGVLRPFYKSAMLSKDGASIKPPHFSWMLFEGSETGAVHQNTLVLSTVLATKFKAGISTTQNFEVEGLGLFLQRGLGYELIPAHSILEKCHEHFGLSPVSLKQEPTTKTLKPSLPRKKNTPAPSMKWLLQTAAVLAFILLANFLVLKVVVKDGSLFTVTQTSLGIFDTIGNLAVEASTLEPQVEEVADVASEQRELLTHMKNPELIEIEPAPVQDFLTGNDVKEITVVVGAFASTRNADKFLARLIEDGYNAKNLGENQQGLTRIGIVNMGDFAENELFVKEVRSGVSNDAWVLD